MLPPDALGVLLVHGGVTQPHIIAFMQEQIARAKNNMVQWVFFDEVHKYMISTPILTSFSIR